MYQNRDPHSISSADYHPRTEFGSVVTTEHGALMITIDVGNDSISIHGTNVLLSEMPADLRQAAVATAAAFNSAFSAQEQRTQVAIIGLLVSEMLRCDSELPERVKQVKLRERYD